MECEVTATAKSGAYRIVTDYFTDPVRNTLLMQVRIHNSTHSNLQVFVRFDASVNDNGGGGAGNGGGDSSTVDSSTGHPVLVSNDTVTATNAVNRDYAHPVFAALDGPFDQATSGFVGTPSDGLTQLDAAHALTQLYTDADNGNVVQTGRLALSPRGNGSVNLALGFGPDSASAFASAEGSLGNFDSARSAYEAGWQTYDAGLNTPPAHLSGLTAAAVHQLAAEYYLSANVVKASEDKTFPGALIASIASPWGQAVSAGDPNNTYFGSYREVFARDVYEAWTGLLLAGDTRTARDVVNFLFNRQQLADGSFPRNSLVNGKTAPDSFNTQLDECSFPIIMAYQLRMFDGALYTAHIKPAANFVVSHGPSFGPERWEEQSGFSPSTISAEIAGLIAAAKIAELNGDRDSAAVWRGVADGYQRNLKTWTLTTNGPASPQPYFIRLSKTGDPNAAIVYNVGNGGPDLDQRAVIDAGFLEYARLGLLKANDPDIVRSLKVVDATIKHSTVNGDGFYRYNGDGYGDGSTDGHPWAPSNKGNGHLWPVLSGERGQWEISQGDTADALGRAKAMAAMGYGVGLIPEQAWELPDLPRSPFGTDPTIASIGFQNGESVGSAAALTWSAAQFVRLMLVIGSGDPLD